MRSLLGKYRQELAERDAMIRQLRDALRFYDNTPFQEQIEDTVVRFDEAKKAMVVSPGKRARVTLTALAPKLKTWGLE